MRIRLSLPMRLSDIARTAGAIDCERNNDPIIEYITTDTREIVRGDLFVALKGKSFNGEDFIGDAVSCGALTLSEKPESSIRVSSSEIALLTLASAYKRRLPLKETVAITGSNGKTTLRELICSLFSSAKLKYHSSEQNYNNLIGVSLSILSAPFDTEYIILECGMNMPSELRRISNAILPSLAVITNIGSSHLLRLKNREGIAKAKLEILCGMIKERVIIPKNEPLLQEILKKRTLSVNAEGGDYTIFSKEREQGAEYSFYSEGRLLLKLYSRLPFSHIKEALGFALAVFSECKLPEASLTDYSLPDRLLHTELITANQVKILNDSYNSSLESIEYAIQTLLKIDAKRRILLLSDVCETIEPEKYHESIGKSISRYSPDLILLYGAYAQNIKDGALSEGYAADKILILGEDHNVDRIAKLTYKLLSPCDAILIKGSHATSAYKLAPLLRELLNENETRTKNT